MSSRQPGYVLARPGIEVANQTDVGCRRENNEDALSYWEPEAESDFQRIGRLAVIADGMGGYEGGQEASRLAVETVLQVYGHEPSSDPGAALVRGFLEAHDRIRRYAEEHPELQGMGTPARRSPFRAISYSLFTSATAGFTLCVKERYNV